jgi:hypothetical protein
LIAWASRDTVISNALPPRTGRHRGMVLLDSCPRSAATPSLGIDHP